MRVEAQPQIGQVLLDISYPSTAVPPTVIVDTTAATLNDVVRELRGLRMDLYRRSWAGRWARFIAWVQSGRTLGG